MSSRAAGVAEARDEVVRVGRSLFSRGYVHASAGNISVRMPGGEAGEGAAEASAGDEFLITPTDAALGFLEADRIAHVGASGEQVSGDRASKTLALHRRIFAADRSAACVIHTHAAHLVALTLSGVWRPDDILPPITPYYVMKVGHVPLIPYHRPGDPVVADLVEAAIEAKAAHGIPLRAVMLDRLGPVVWGETPSAAMAVLEELEETARLWLLTDRQPAPLSEAHIHELRETFNAPW